MVGPRLRVAGPDRSAVMLHWGIAVVAGIAAGGIVGVLLGVASVLLLDDTEVPW